METVFYYIDCLSKCTMMLNKGFLDEYMPLLTSAVQKKLLTASEASLKNVKKDRIDGIIQGLVNGLMSRQMTYRQREQEKMALSLVVGAAFLAFNFLEKRIDGAKMIQEVCKNASVMTYSTTTEVLQNVAYRQQQLQFVG